MEVTYTSLMSHTTDVPEKAKVLALVKEFPYRTARELAHKINPEIVSPDSIHKRLPELMDDLLITTSLFRKCSITGRRAKTWVAL